MLIPLSLLLAPQAFATGTTPQPVQFPTVCPPGQRPCIRQIRCADGIDFDLDWLRDFADLFPDGVRSLEITLVVEEGALDLFVDGQRLDPVDAVVTGNRYVWTIPAPSNPALQFVTENRVDGLTVYEVFVAGSSERP